MKKLAMLLVAFAAVTFFGASDASAQSVSFSYVHGGRGGYTSFHGHFGNGYGYRNYGGYRGGYYPRVPYVHVPRVYVPRVYVPRVYVAPPVYMAPPVYAPVYNPSFVAQVTESVYDPYYGSRRVVRTVTVVWNPDRGCYTWIGLDGYIRNY